VSGHPRSLSLGGAAALLLSACVGDAPVVRPVAGAVPDVVLRTRVSAQRAAQDVTPIALVDAAPARRAPERAAETGDELQLFELLENVERHFPLLLAAQEEIALAEAEQLAARGRFDLRVIAQGDYAVDGYYQNEQTRLGLEQPTGLGGTTFFGGYKLGTGDFPIYDDGLRSNEGGELNAGLRVPLLAGRAIDPRRLAVWRAELSRAQADPAIAAKRLEVARRAAHAYWKWVAAGQKRLIFERLLRLAEDRQATIEQSAALGDLPPLSVDDNQRLVVERRAIMVDAERELQRAAIELSLYLRSAEGAPRQPEASELPIAFPVSLMPDQVVAGDDGQRALRLRPELRTLNLELDKLQLELEQARNDLLPRLDVGAAVSQDLGDDVTVTDTKGPFELDLFFRFEVPLQRRTAEGRARELEARQRKARRELQFAADSVTAEVQDAASELQQAWESIALVRESARLASILEDAERAALGLGDSNLIDVNIREQQTAAAAARLIDSLATYFRALADYKAALGVTD